MAKKTVRRCSVCRAVGHDKRRCKKNPVAPAKKKKKAATRPPVVVRVGTGSPRSEHVVNLRPSHMVNPDRVRAFREAFSDHAQPSRQVMNVAGVVKQANQETKIEQLEAEVKRLKDRLTHAHKEKEEKRETHIPIEYEPVFHHAPKRKKKRRAVRMPSVSLPRVTITHVQKSVSVVMALLLILIIPFPAFSYYKQVKQDSAVVVEESTQAFLALQSSTLAALSANIGQAQLDLNNALASFSEAKNIVEQDHGALTFVAGMLPVVGKHVTSRHHVLRSGHYLALGNTYLVKGIKTAGEATDMKMTDRFAIIRDHLRSAMPQYRLALEDLSAVDEKTLPVEYQQSFGEFKLLFATFINDMEDIADLVDLIHDMLGADDFKRYLVMFQNHHEIRATGGFLGSFALVDVQKGKVLNIDVPGGGTYDLQGQLGVYVEPPLPLQLVNGRWEFQDSNWFPDFPASAKKMEWFYQHGRGATVDGVIAINASVLERFLRVIGPISNDEYGLILNSDNVLAQLQQEVEVDYDKEENKPKAVLASLLDQLLTGLKDIDADAAVRLLAELHDAATEKEIQVYVHDKALQDRIQSFGWTGEVVQTAPTQDYLMVVNTNVQGAKSDAKISQDVRHNVSVQEDGRIINTVEITRTHSGEAGEQFYGRPNINFMRVYVPQGSKLLGADGFTYPPEESFHVPEEWYNVDPDLVKYEREVGVHAESGTRVTQEFGKTVFGNWMVVAPGESHTVSFVYELPMRIQMNPDGEDGGTIAHRWKDLFLAGMQRHGSRYSVFLQKQSGVDGAVETQIAYPEGWSPVWRSRDDVDLHLNGAVFRKKLEEDATFGIVMEKKKA